MPQLEVEVAVAKIGKYATSESGDTLEMVERPQGGLSLVLADGQRSGKAAKSISNIVVRKAIALLAEGVRDGAVARAAHDYLRTMRGGKVSATLNIVSVDLETETIVISRNSHCPTVAWIAGEIAMLDEPSEAVGIYTWTKPVITELSLAPHTYVIVFTDGVVHAGRRRGQPLDVLAIVQEFLPQSTSTSPLHMPPQALADVILAAAIASDEGRPADDISVLVVAVLPSESDADDVRRLSVRFPIRVKRASLHGRR
jgi:serine phosphatase RsbU (regulator of sigma subunit)